MSPIPDTEKVCVVIPAFREAGRIGSVVQGVLRYCPHVLVVDDGSPDNTAAEAEKAGARVVRHTENMGKGAALENGFAYAGQNQFEFAITMDADGQHDPADMPAFLRKYEETGQPVLVGTRMQDRKAMPFVRRMTNLFMSGLLSRRMKQHVPDTQCGYRMYRMDAVAGIKVESRRFDSESEILLRIAAKGISIGAVPIRVIYRDEKSKIRPVRDTVRFFRMLRKITRGES